MPSCAVRVKLRASPRQRRTALSCGILQRLHNGRPSVWFHIVFHFVLEGTPLHASKIYNQHSRGRQAGGCKSEAAVVPRAVVREARPPPAHPGRHNWHHVSSVILQRLLQRQRGVSLEFACQSPALHFAVREHRLGALPAGTWCESRCPYPASPRRCATGGNRPITHGPRRVRAARPDRLGAPRS